MKKNIGSVDKMIRIIIGIALLSLYFLLEGGMKYISLIGIVLLLTALLKFCPLYTLFGMNTDSTKK